MENESPVEITEKRLLQKIAKVIAIISFITAIICLLIVAFVIDKSDEVIMASFGASAFFFFMVALVLNVMSDTNIPNLKISDKKEQDL